MQCIHAFMQTNLEARWDDVRLFLALYRERFADIGLFENEIYPGIEDVLSALAVSGRRLFVATSKPTVYADRIIDHFKLRTYFGRVFGSELDGTRSDKTELLSYALKTTHVDPAQAISNLEGTLATAVASVSTTSDEIGKLAHRVSDLLENNDEQIVRVVSKAEETLDRIRMVADNTNVLLYRAGVTAPVKVTV